MIAQHGTLEISASRLAANIGLFQSRVGPSVQLCATIKANAYGHGLPQLLPLLHRHGINWTAVYNLHEAQTILTITPEMKILVLSPLTLRENAILEDGLLPLLATGKVRVDITDTASVTRLGRLLSRANIPRRIPVHVQVDTGLTRAGAAASDIPALIAAIAAEPQLKLEGLFSHLSHGDEPGHATVATQFQSLQAVATEVKKQFPDLMVHLQNSGGAWHLPASQVNMARVGIGLYGLQPSLADPIAGLQPIARLIAPILIIHQTSTGVGVGYGHTFVTKRPSRLAVVPVGYADGYPRDLSNRGVVQIHHPDSLHTAPVVGRVSMDQIVVDVTDLPHAQIGDTVTVMSSQNNAPNSVDQIAQTCNTIGYEIATGWGPRLQRRVVD